MFTSSGVFYWSVCTLCPIRRITHNRHPVYDPPIYPQFRKYYCQGNHNFHPRRIVPNWYIPFISNETNIEPIQDNSWPYPIVWATFKLTVFSLVRFLVCSSLKNAYGVNPRKELWGRCRLYCFLQVSIFCWASWRVRNQCSLRHSSRNLPLKLSIKALSCGLPGRICSIRIPRLKAHWWNSRLVNSGPLSPRVRFGYPQRILAWSMHSVTAFPVIERCATIPGDILVKSSTMVRILSRFLSPYASDMKSIDQTSFGSDASGIGILRGKRCFFLVRFLMDNPSSL